MTDFDYQVKYQRAFEAVMWAIPAVSMYRFRAAAFDDLGANNNDILAYSAPASPRLEALTANSSIPYIAAYADLRNGPVVLDLPAASDGASLYGQVVDAWQLTIADVGPAGLDAGNGARYLITPPGYDEAIPDGFLHVPSPNFRISFAFRSVPAAGRTPADAYGYAKTLRVYDLVDAENPPEQRFLDPFTERYATLPFYDERYFDDVHAIVSVEPVKTEDKIIMGMLETLGIRHGRDFTPDETAIKAMRQAAIDVYYFADAWYDENAPKRRTWADRNYFSLFMPDENRRFTYTYDDRIDTIARVMQYALGTYVPKELSTTPVNEYLSAFGDSTGKLLQGGKTYRMDIPADMPVRQFWSVTVYDRATFSFIYSESDRTTLSAFDVPGMTKNGDGTVSLYIGPVAPDGLESNWIPTSGKRPLPTIRFYGAEPALYDGTFRMPDVVAIS
ncbi:DUF1214 domain-containing protein [Subtercola sp. YIM 133946]|uniref:DUF1214 domain-containing protein n=1 Tax=Subtercola sp. YIM 133946 TaxID=3118909 RepID=UPI002F928D13